MSQENVEIVTRWLDAYNRRDLETLRALHDPDVELDWSASPGVQAGVYRGIDAVLRVCTDGFDSWEEFSSSQTASSRLVSRSLFRT